MPLKRMKKKLVESSTYQTSDIIFAAVLLEEGYEIMGTEPSADNFRQVMFLFENSKDLEDLRSRYVRGLIKVEPNSFQNSLRLLKTMAKNAV